MAIILILPTWTFAQVRTTVSDTLYDPTGNPLSGYLIVNNTVTFESSDGFQIPAGSQIQVAVANGAFSVQLVPNIGATPSGTSYQVHYYLGSLRTIETWVVPQTPNPAHLADVRSVSTPQPGVQFSASQLEPPSTCSANLFLEWQTAGWTCAQPAVSSLSGIASVTQGGTGTGVGFPTGAVVLAGASGDYTQDVSNFQWDAVNHRLGIQVGAPAYALDVTGPASSNVPVVRFWAPNGSSNAQVLRLYNSGAPGPGSTARLAFANQTTNNGETQTAYIDSTMTDVAASTYSADLVFSATSGGNLAERARITGAGRVGIGTSTPALALDVSGAARSSLASVSFSSTPIFDASLGNTQEITLTGNVSSSTLSNAAAGETLNFIICQDATGSRTFAWPPNIEGGMTIGSTASTCSAQSFLFDGLNAYALSLGVTNM